MNFLKVTPRCIITWCVGESGFQLQLIFPYLDLDIKYFDLGILNRDATEDRVTVESALAALK